MARSDVHRYAEKPYTSCGSVAPLPRAVRDKWKVVKISYDANSEGFHWMGAPNNWGVPHCYDQGRSKGCNYQGKTATKYDRGSIEPEDDAWSTDKANRLLHAAVPLECNNSLWNKEREPARLIVLATPSSPPYPLLTSPILEAPYNSTSTVEGLFGGETDELYLPRQAEKLVATKTPWSQSRPISLMGDSISQFPTNLTESSPSLLLPPVEPSEVQDSLAGHEKQGQQNLEDFRGALPCPRRSLSQHRAQKNSSRVTKKSNELVKSQNRIWIRRV
ncbi:hypothetical protein TWF970_010804 [Orbilia oligospora]|uniref:Uncharacterized protein n=1 Tax=Orbilia oligospora TaxID=2813651 RepID=A0A7C8V4M9_ORBOL|nr:hypothetical protein TWF970_010804 [Orbilia oligospora]